MSFCGENYFIILELSLFISLSKIPQLFYTIGMIPIQKIIGKKSDELRSGGFAGPGALNNGADITFCTVQSGIVVSGDFRIKPFCDK